MAETVASEKDWVVIRGALGNNLEVVLWQVYALYQSREEAFRAAVELMNIEHQKGRAEFTYKLMPQHDTEIEETGHCLGYYDTKGQRHPCPDCTYFRAKYIWPGRTIHQPVYIPEGWTSRYQCTACARRESQGITEAA